MINKEVIKKSRLFENLDEDEFNVLLSLLEPRYLKKGDVIFNEGEPGKEMFILLSGKLGAWVNRMDGIQRQMFEIHPGDFFGEMSIIANESRSATLIAAVDSELMAIKGIDFYRIIFEQPAAACKVLNTIRKVQNTWLEQISGYLNDLMRWGETARRRAVMDELTGLYNRRFLEESAQNRFSQGNMGLRSISLLMIDLDKIHTVNETYGVKSGDEVLRTMGKILLSSTRSGDICARLAGDEFAVLLPDTEPAVALRIAERIRSTIAAKKIKVSKTPESEEMIEIVTHTSLGIASAPIHAQTWEALFHSADNALRDAKERGRNRVEISGGLF